MERIRPTTRSEAWQRALAMLMAVPPPPKGAPLDAGNRPIAYRLDDSGELGGDDPNEPICADWSFGNRTPTSDCIGLVLWASGLARRQPGYNGTRGEWLNCASLMDDALSAVPRWGKTIRREHALPGDWLLTRDHIGMVIRGPTVTSDVLVVDCSPRHGRAHAIGTGYPWSDSCVVVRPLHYTEPGRIAAAAALKAA
jgi:hypothetical protein